MSIYTPVHVALVKGRHETPATDWVFDTIEDVHDYDAMNKHAGDYFLELMQSANMALYQSSDFQFQTAHDMWFDVRLYVTGLTPALVATLKAWEEMQMRGFQHRLTLMHYDRDTDSYKEQPWWDGLLNKVARKIWWE